MLVRMFRQNQPAVLFLLALVVPLVWPASGPDAPIGAFRFREGMPLYRLLAPVWAGPWWLQWLVGVLLTSGTALLLDRLSNEAELFERRNHLPALLFPLVLALGPSGLWPDPALFGLPWVLWSFSSCWSAQGRSSALGKLFDAGLLLGVASLWYMPYLFLVVVIWASVAVMRPFSWREHVLPVVGLCLPMFLCWGVLEVAGSDAWHPIATARDHQLLGSSAPRSWMLKVLGGVVLIPLALASILAFASVYQRSIMREKNVRSSFLAASLGMAVLIGFEWMLNRTFPGVLMAMPVSVLFTYGLLRVQRTWLVEAGVALLFGLALWARWAA
jgi:hypothetical protein